MLLRSGGTFRRWGLVESLSIIKGVPSKGKVGPQFFSLFFSSGHKMNNSALPHTPVMWYFLFTGLKAVGPTDHQVKSPKL
jgi:hypothetical protein